MEYQERLECYKILQKTSFWSNKKDKEYKQLACISHIKKEATIKNIDLLIDSLSLLSPSVREEAIKVLIYLFENNKPGNHYQDSLKHLRLSRKDLEVYKKWFATDQLHYLFAIASFNGNGYVREKAVEELGTIAYGKKVQFLLNRLNDWVAQVRHVASEALRKQMVKENLYEFIEAIPQVISLEQKSRVDLDLIRGEILSFITSFPINNDTISWLQTQPEKVRENFYHEYILNKGLSIQLAKTLLCEKSFLVRIVLIKFVEQLDEISKRIVLLQLLKDKVARVRLKAFYAIKESKEEYNDIVSNGLSDESSSVSELCRYYLKDKNIDVRTLYIDNLKNGIVSIGNILGLAEVNEKKDLEIFKTLIFNCPDKLILPCLLAMLKIDFSTSREYVISKLDDGKLKITSKSVFLLKHFSDEEVMRRYRDRYVYGSKEQKSVLLQLFQRVGGWKVLGDLILGLKDEEEEIRIVSAVYLKRWLDKSVNLFVQPTAVEINRAKSALESITDKSPLSEELWFLLRNQ